MAGKGNILVGTVGQGVMTSADDGESWTRASVRQGTAVSVGSKSRSGSGTRTRAITTSYRQPGAQSNWHTA